MVMLTMEQDKQNTLYLKQFEHYISLGHCCFVAMDLEKMGLRDSSMPFDWTRTRWSAIERSFTTHFADYLDYESLFQKKNALNAYKNIDYGVGFFHDFDEYTSLIQQLPAVQKKYNRRISRFFKNITDSTLFIRYCWGLDELKYISSHYDEIEAMIKRFNCENEIVFISHDSPNDFDISSIKYLYFISKDENEELNENPITDCKELFDYLKQVYYPKRESNLRFIEHKEIERKKKKRSLKYKIKSRFSLKKKIYVHNKQI